MRKINKILAEMAEKILYDSGCALCWGEVEVPDCLKKEVEEKQKDLE